MITLALHWHKPEANFKETGAFVDLVYGTSESWY